MITPAPAIAVVAVLIALAQAGLGPPRQRLQPGVMALGVLLAGVGFAVASLLAASRPGTWAAVAYAGWAIMMILWTATAQHVFAEDDDESDDEEYEPDDPDEPGGAGPHDPDEPEIDWDAFERDFGDYVARELTYR